MKTIAFDGVTREEAEERKAEWLYANPGAIVRTTRVVFLAQGSPRLAKPTYRRVIQIDYDYRLEGGL
jgi:hypothetical protein